MNHSVAFVRLTTRHTHTRTHTRKQRGKCPRVSNQFYKCANISRIGFPDYKSTVQIFNVEKCQQQTITFTSRVHTHCLSLHFSHYHYYYSILTKWCVKYRWRELRFINWQSLNNHIAFENIFLLVHRLCWLMWLTKAYAIYEENWFFFCKHLNFLAWCLVLSAPMEHKTLLHAKQTNQMKSLNCFPFVICV